MISFQFPPLYPRFFPTHCPQCPKPLPYCTKEERKEPRKGRSRREESGHPLSRFQDVRSSEKGQSCSGRTEWVRVTRQLASSDVLPPPLAPPAGVHSSFLSAGVSKISCSKVKQKSGIFWWCFSPQHHLLDVFTPDHSSRVPPSHPTWFCSPFLPIRFLLTTNLD